MLLYDELRGLLHDVPPDQGPVRHQTVHHIQHVGGTASPYLHVCLSSSQRLILPPLCCQVADRLFSSFGQDILDALYWTATEPKEKKRAHIGVIPHFFMAVLYVCILTV